MADRDVKIDIIAEDNTGRATRSAAKNFEKLERDTNKVLKGIAEFGSDIAGSLGSTVSKAVTAAGPEVSAAIGGVLVAGAVAAAPFIGAAITGAIIGGIGLGGVVGGFVLAAQDERVKSAFGAMKEDIGNQLKDAAEPFVDTSIRGIDQIGRAIKGINFKQIFGDSAQNTAPLIDGITRAVTELGGAVQNIIHNAGPVLTEIGREVGALGSTVAQGLNSLADNSKDGASALRELFLVINGTISATFQFVNALTEVYGALERISGGGLLGALDAIASASVSVADKSRAVAQGAIDAANATGQFGQQAGAAAGPIQTFTDKVNQLSNSNRTLFDTTTNVGEALDRTAEAAKKNGRTLDANTEKGRANRTALSNLANALVAQYNATVQVNGEGIKSNAVAASNRAAFIRQAQAFGVSKDAAARLATQMGLIPAKKNTDFHANTHDAEARARALQAKIDAIHGKTVTVEVHYSATGREALNASGHRIGGFDGSTAFTTSEGTGTHRTGGPNQVSQPITNDVRVFVDGSPMRAEIREAQRKENHRNTVGRRYAYGR